MVGNTRERVRALNHMIEARRKFCFSPDDLGLLQSVPAEAFHKRLARIELLLREGKDSEAILLANIGAALELSYPRGSAFGKANFNPNEPRDDRTKEWTKGEDSTGARVEYVQYRGYVHDQMVDQVMQDLKTAGAAAVKNVRILGINGVLAIPDIGAIGGTDPNLSFIEVKTGFDPKFTPNQDAVYALIRIGGHATSFDPRIELFGLKMGALLPPMHITLMSTLGPGMPVFLTDYCKSIKPR